MLPALCEREHCKSLVRKLTVNIRIERHDAGQPQTTALGKPNGPFPSSINPQSKAQFPSPVSTLGVGWCCLMLVVLAVAARAIYCSECKTRISRLQPDSPVPVPLISILARRGSLCVCALCWLGLLVVAIYGG